jgi:hypothetical protein
MTPACNCTPFQDHEPGCPFTPEVEVVPAVPTMAYGSGDYCEVHQCHPTQCPDPGGEGAALPLAERVTPGGTPVPAPEPATTPCRGCGRAIPWVPASRFLQRDAWCHRCGGNAEHVRT